MINPNNIEQNLKHISDYINISDNNDEEVINEIPKRIDLKKEQVNLYSTNKFNNTNLEQIDIIEKYDNIIKTNKNNFEQHICKLETELNKEKENNIILEQKINELTDNINKNKLELDKKNNTLTELKADYKKVKSEVQSLLESKLQLNDKINEKNIIIENNNNIIKELEYKLEITKENELKINTENNSYITKIETLNNKIQLLTNDNKQLITKNKQLEEDIIYNNRVHKEDIDNIIKEYQSKGIKFNEEINLLNSEISKLKIIENNFNKLVTENNDLKKEYESAVLLTDKLDKKVDEYMKELAIKSETIENLNKENSELNLLLITSYKKISNYTNINEKIYTELSNSKNKEKVSKFNFENTIESLTTTLQKYITKEQINSAKIEELNSTIDIINKKITELNKENISLIESKNENITIINNLKSDIDNLENILENITNNYNTLEKEGFEKDSEITNLTYCVENCFFKIKLYDSFIANLFDNMSNINYDLKIEDSYENLLNNLNDNIINIDLIEGQLNSEDIEKSFNYFEGIMLRFFDEFTSSIKENNKLQNILEDKEKHIFEYKTEINRLKNDNKNINNLFKNNSDSSSNNNIKLNKDILIASSFEQEELKYIIKEYKDILYIINEYIFNKNNSKINDLVNLYDNIFEIKCKIKLCDNELITINKKLKEKDGYKLYIDIFDTKNKELKLLNKKLYNLEDSASFYKSDLKSYCIVYNKRMQETYNNPVKEKKVIEKIEHNDLNFEKIFESNNDNNKILKEILKMGISNNIIKNIKQ